MGLQQLQQLQHLIETKTYLDDFKKDRVIFRKYPKNGLMIVKRKFGLPYSDEVDKLWLNYCRGLVIDYINHKIVFIPPVKSKEILTSNEFNDVTDESYSNLVDGTMVNLFYHNNEWIHSTRSNIGCDNKWTQDMNFKDMFMECSKNLDYESFNEDYTYSFVMRHKKNRLTSPVDTNELILIEVYHKLVRLDILPDNRGYKLMSAWIPPALNKGYSGYRDGLRYKWLTNEHKFIVMIQPNTNNPCLNYLILRHSGHLTSYLKMFPEKRFEFDEYRKKVHTITQLTYQYYCDVYIHKELNKQDIPFALRPLLYEIHGHYLEDKQGISWSYIKQYIHDLAPNRLQFVINNL